MLGIWEKIPTAALVIALLATADEQLSVEEHDLLAACAVRLAALSPNTTDHEVACVVNLAHLS